VLWGTNPLLKQEKSMKLEVRRIPEEGITLSYQKDAGEFDSLRELAQDAEIQFIAPLDIVLDVHPERDFVGVKGRLETTVRLNCSRCLESFDMPVRQRFTLRYSHNIPVDLHPSDAGGIELTAENIGLIFYGEGTIDFRAAIQEQVVLAIPYKALCSEGCKGLCPGCGADLNNENCRCRSAQTVGPFSVLKNLKLSR
jgi:uncharacterized protein